MKRISTGLGIAAIWAALLGGVEATPESRAAAPFLLFQPSARSAGMGEAYIAISDDANSTYYNPAALADDEHRDMSYTIYRPVPNLANDIFTSFGSYTQPFSSIGNLGFSLTYTSLGEQTRTDQQGQDLGTFTSWGMALGASYGTYVTKSMSLGLTVKFIHENLAGQGAGQEQGKGSGSSFAGDLGFMWKLSDRFTAAWVLRNVGPNITFIDADQADPLPQNFTVGMAYHVYKSTHSSVLVSYDVYKPLADEGFFSFVTGWSDSPAKEEFKDMDHHVGAEWRYALSEESAIALRAGYSHDEDGNRKTPTFGFGLKYNWASMDVAYFANNSTPAGDSFRFTMGLSF